MRREDFSYGEHGFCGHLAEPDSGTDRAVIVIMGGEQSLLPGVMIAERFADYGIAGLAVSLFGAPGLKESPDRVPLDMMVPAVNYLREKKHISHLSVYGQSMGSIFACLAAQYIGGMENLILVSPTHVPFEGTESDRKTMSGHSVVTWKGKELPFVRADFSRVKAMKYDSHPAVTYPVMGMWKAYYDAYRDEAAVKKAVLKAEETDCRILMICGQKDEAWPSEHSVNEMLRRLRQKNYRKEVRTVRFPHGSHLTGMMPDRDREKQLYRMIPLVGLMYRTFGKYREENLEYFRQAESEIIRWLRNPL